MSYLIDTNVISELVPSKPDAAVLDWSPNTPDKALFLSVLMLGQIRKAVEKLPEPQRREKLRLPAIDSLLAATAPHHDLRLVTRNIKHFDYAGLEVINPWETATR